MSVFSPIVDYRISEHARLEMDRRQISEIDLVSLEILDASRRVGLPTQIEYQVIPAGVPSP